MKNKNNHLWTKNWCGNRSLRENVRIIRSSWCLTWHVPGILTFKNSRQPSTKQKKNNLFYFFKTMRICNLNIIFLFYLFFPASVFQLFTILLWWIIFFSLNFLICLIKHFLVLIKFVYQHNFLVATQIYYF